MPTLVTFGPVEANVIAQITNCQTVEDQAPAVLCADNHLGYSMPIGGVVGYEGLISPSAVGFDIACGNCAARTDVKAAEVNIPQVMTDIWRLLSFGMGRKKSGARRPSCPRRDRIVRLRRATRHGEDGIAAAGHHRGRQSLRRSVCG